MNRVMLYGGAALAGGLVLYLLVKRKAGEGLAATAGASVVHAAEDFSVGAVKGVGEIFGIPDTNQDQCSKDLAAGNTWDASFSCPASRFLGGVWNSTTIKAAQVADLSRVEGTGYDAMGNVIYGGQSANVGVTGSW